MGQPDGVPALELTGERTLPNVPEENYWFRRHLAVYEWIAVRVDGMRVADLACGEGYGSDVLADRAAEVVGIDANPEAHYNLQGQAWRGRIQTYDAPFGLQRSDSFYLTAGGRRSYIRGRAANPLFDDSDPNRYFQPFVAAGLPRVGVKTAGAGVEIQVLQQEGTGMRIRVY